MTRFLQRLAIVTNWFTQAALWLSATGLIVMTAIIGWQVFSRYVLNDSPAWSESFALVLMLYYILLAAAVGVREGFHLGIRLILDHLPTGWRRAALILNHTLVGLFGFMMYRNGLALADYTSSHIIPTLGISRAVAYWPFAMSGLLILLFSLEHLLYAASNGKASSKWN